MPAPPPARRLRFGIFEADPATGELRRKGARVKLNAQPFQLLVMLLERPGELLTREEIARALWPEGTFVDFDHGVNAAVNRIREALGDTAANPRFVETLARRGYRFIAPVEAEAVDQRELEPAAAGPASVAAEPALAEHAEQLPTGGILATADDLPRAPHRLVETLFLLLQLMYVGFYVGALANLAEIEELFAPLSHPSETLLGLIVTAGVMIPVRAFVIFAVLFHAPGARRKFLTLWPMVLAMDVVWSLAPFLLLHHIPFGLALACVPLLVYSPFAQRALVLMGAGEAPRSPENPPFG
jgi:DNA-binding winged helix-turn-helix (wHTH) protein